MNATETAKPTARQEAVIRYFSGDLTAAVSRVNAAVTYRVCRERGWIVATEEFPFHRTTDAGLAALGFFCTWHKNREYGTPSTDHRWETPICERASAELDAQYAAETANDQPEPDSYGNY